MKNWLKALFSQTLFSAWWILSSLSTLSTFFFPQWAGKPRIVSAFCAVLRFAWANFRVFQKQQRELLKMKKALDIHEERRSRLRIVPDDGSRYILRPLDNTGNGDFRGGCFEFHLMIENTGRRNSTINNYSIEILELGRTFPNLRTSEGRNGVQGRHCHFGLYPPSILSVTGSVRIDAESMTNRGVLLFDIPDIDLEQFVNSGLTMTGQDRRFGPLHCRLTPTDTMGSSVTHEFEMPEA